MLMHREEDSQNMWGNDYTSCEEENITTSYVYVYAFIFIFIPIWIDG